MITTPLSTLPIDTTPVSYNGDDTAWGSFCQAEDRIAARLATLPLGTYLKAASGTAHFLWLHPNNQEKYALYTTLIDSDGSMDLGEAESRFSTGMTWFDVTAREIEIHAADMVAALISWETEQLDLDDLIIAFGYVHPDVAATSPITVKGVSYVDGPVWRQRGRASTNMRLICEGRLWSVMGDTEMPGLVSEGVPAAVREYVIDLLQASQKRF